MPAVITTIRTFEDDRNNKYMKDVIAEYLELDRFDGRVWKLEKFWIYIPDEKKYMLFMLQYGNHHFIVE